MTEAVKKTVRRLNSTDKAYLEQLYLNSVDRKEILEFIEVKFPSQYEKVQDLPEFKLRITIYNLKTMLYIFTKRNSVDFTNFCKQKTTK